MTISRTAKGLFYTDSTNVVGGEVTVASNTLLVALVGGGHSTLGGSANLLSDVTWNSQSMTKVAEIGDGEAYCSIWCLWVSSGDTADLTATWTYDITYLTAAAVQLSASGSEILSGASGGGMNSLSPWSYTAGENAYYADRIIEAAVQQSSASASSWTWPNGSSEDTDTKGQEETYWDRFCEGYGTGVDDPPTCGLSRSGSSANLAVVFAEFGVEPEPLTASAQAASASANARAATALGSPIASASSATATASAPAATADTPEPQSVAAVAATVTASAPAATVEAIDQVVAAASASASAAAGAATADVGEPPVADAVAASATASAGAALADTPPAAQAVAASATASSPAATAIREETVAAAAAGATASGCDASAGMGILVAAASAGLTATAQPATIQINAAAVSATATASARPATVLPGPVSVGAQPARAMASAKPATVDASGPIVVRTSPPEDGEIGKRDPATCTVYDDTEVDPQSIAVWVDGRPAYTARRGFLSAWRASSIAYSEESGGFDLALAPAGRWAAGGHSVRIVAEDINGRAMDSTWSFSGPARAFTFTTWGLVYEGLRKADGGGL